jgi:hypothetical protein
MATFVPITTIPQLINLCREDPKNIGVSPSGEMFTYDFGRGTKRKVTREEASELLSLSLEIIDEIIKSNGHFVLPDPSSVEDDPEPFADLPEDYDEEEFEMPDDYVEQMDERDTEESEEDSIPNPDPDRLEVIERKVDKLQKSVDIVINMFSLSQTRHEAWNEEIVKLLTGLYL